MRQATICHNGQEAGELIQFDDGTFMLRYNDLWMVNNKCPAISLNLPKTQQEYRSKFLFPFFFNMLPEGSNKEAICKDLRIDDDDYFGLLLAVAQYDTIGAVTVIKK